MATDTVPTETDLQLEHCRQRAEEIKDELRQTEAKAAALRRQRRREVKQRNRLAGIRADRELWRAYTNRYKWHSFANEFVDRFPDSHKEDVQSYLHLNPDELDCMVDECLRLGFVVDQSYCIRGVFTDEAEWETWKSRKRPACEWHCVDRVNLVDERGVTHIRRTVEGVLARCFKVDDVRAYIRRLDERARILVDNILETMDERRRKKPRL